MSSLDEAVVPQDRVDKSKARTGPFSFVHLHLMLRAQLITAIQLNFLRLEKTMRETLSRLPRRRRRRRRDFYITAAERKSQPARGGHSPLARIIAVFNARKAAVGPPVSPDLSRHARFFLDVARFRNPRRGATGLRLYLFARPDRMEIVRSNPN